MKNITAAFCCLWILALIGLCFAQDLPQAEDQDVMHLLVQHRQNLFTQRSSEQLLDIEKNLLRNSEAQFTMPYEPSAAARDDTFSNIIESTFDTTFKIITNFNDTLFFGSEIKKTESQYTYINVQNQYGAPGSCFLGSEWENSYEYNVIILGSGSTIEAEYYYFNVTGDTLSGEYFFMYTDGDFSSHYALTGARRQDAGANTYYIPYMPARPEISDFALGFAFSNTANVIESGVTITYYSSGGTELGTQTFSIPAGGQYSDMASVQPDEPGWARVQATLPVNGMGLVFGFDDLMYDVDIISEAATNLNVNHVALEGGWNTKAMLCNPNPFQAEVTVTLHPKAGGTSSSDTFTIPAMGAIQYDLGALGGEGSASIASTQPLAGFELYDGRDGTGHNWLGGLSITAE